MIQFKIDDKQSFDFPESLKDITLKKYIDYIDFVESTKPNILKDIDSINDKLQDASYNNDLKEVDKLKAEIFKLIDSIDEVIKYQQLFPYYARVVSFFSNLDVTYILGTDGSGGMKVENLTWLYLHITKIFNYLPEVEYSNVLEVNGEAWYLPERFMTDSTVIEYAESAQFQSNMAKVEGGDWKSLAKIMCVLVRKKDEQYTDKLLKREEIFLNWDLYNCWCVAFFFLKRVEILNLNSAIYTSILNLRQLKQELIN